MGSDPVVLDMATYAVRRGAEGVESLTYSTYAWKRRTMSAERLAKHFPLHRKYERRYQEELSKRRRDDPKETA